MKLKRYVYVGGPNSSVAHITFDRRYTVSGAKTACGRRTEARWWYWLGRYRVPKDRTVCKSCVR